MITCQSFCVCTEDGAVANLTSIHADATVTCMTQNKHSLRAQSSVCSSHAVNGQSKARLVTVHIQCHLSHSRIHCCLTYFFKMYFSSIIHPTVLPTYSSHYFHYTLCSSWYLTMKTTCIGGRTWFILHIHDHSSWFHKGINNLSPVVLLECWNWMRNCLNKQWF